MLNDPKLTPRTRKRKTLRERTKDRIAQKRDHAATQRMELPHQSDTLMYWGIFPKNSVIYYPTPPSPEVGGDNEGGVDVGSTRVFINAMNIIESYGKKGTVIRVLINCLGGDEYQGMAVYDTIRQSKYTVIIEGRGQIMSMGVFILQAGNRRILSENARLMIHEGTWGVGDEHSRDSTRTAREGRKLKNIYRDVLLGRIREKHPEYSRRKLDGMLMFDTYFSAKEAVDLGLADEIIKPAQK